MQKCTVLIVSFLFLLTTCLVASGEEYVLVCHKECPVDQLTAQEVERIFLGKMRKWPDGSGIKIVVNSNEEVHAQFTRNMLNKSPSQFSNYWRKILFSGKNILPVMVESDVDAQNYLLEHANALTYINVTNLNNTVKKILVAE
jgi:ABC-type phosphate transport system substrate-binding protein